MGPLAGDKELGVLALGVQGVGSDDAPGQVQRPGQRREPGDLAGLAVHPDLAEHNTTALIEGGQRLYPAAPARFWRLSSGRLAAAGLHGAGIVRS